MSATGPTHDIGKICVPLHILKKTTPLTKTERGFLEYHAAAGYVLLGYYFKNRRHLACTVALDHHERRNRSGYPRGILLEDPLVEIIAVADIYDALIMPRPYRSGAYDNRTALEEITEMANQKKISWDVVKALIIAPLVLTIEKSPFQPREEVHLLPITSMVLSQKKLTQKTKPGSQERTDLAPTSRTPYPRPFQDGSLFEL